LVDPRDGNASEPPAGSHISSSAVNNKKLNGDWQENLGSGASVGAGNYPAKYSFMATTAYCGGAAQPDFVVYNTGLAGASNQATIVAYDNLYSGCAGTVPSTYWAYNTGTGAKVLTSPAFSRDGKQVAFVQTDGGFGFLVLLKWAASTTESVSSPRTLTAVGNGSYRGCTAPCMTTIALKDGNGVETDDTTSSIFADISDDIGWVGGANGWLHKITGIFLGTPAEVTGSSFPVQVNPGNVNVLTNPVHDFASDNVFVGDAGGFLYRVNATTGAVTTSGQLDFGVGIVQGPIVDSSNGLVYVFASSDGSLNCSAGTTACTGVYQLATSFVSGATGNEAAVGTSTASGTNPNPLYLGAFDIGYENSTNATGNLYVCGNTGADPTLYRIPIQAGVMGTPASIAALTAAAKTPACSPVSDVSNPNAAGGAAEWVFSSVTNNAHPTVCASKGCILNFVSAPWQASTAYAVGQRILVLRAATNTMYINVAIVAGTSAATPPATWPGTAGMETVDGGVTWLTQGTTTVTALASWKATNAYTKNTRILDSNGNVEVVTKAGTSAGTAPTWKTIAGANTGDGGVTWINAGAWPSSAFAATGGTSGVVIDNTVGSGTLPGASQIYFSTLGNQPCSTSGGTGGCAVQASQSALQ
jgi:hypothetical protein